MSSVKRTLANIRKNYVEARIPGEVLAVDESMLPLRGRLIFRQYNPAEELLEKQTHLIGTLRKNRKGNPKEITTAKKKKGEIVFKENNKEIVNLKWN
ncbi:UNVERIFIED_CONTAM: hypothetical protein RMT77_008892 [Armadillidium vulgare]